MGNLIQLCTEASRKDEPFTKGSWPAAGMGYVFVTDGGRLLVIDGGETEGDAEALVSLLERKFGGHPVVDLWILTHAPGAADRFPPLRLRGDSGFVPGDRPGKNCGNPRPSRL